MKNVAMTCAAIGSAVLLWAGLAIGGSLNITVPQEGLLGYWTGDGDALDHSGNGNDGVFWGNGSYAPGVNGQAFQFRSHSGVDIPNRSYWRMASDASYAFWVRTDQASAWNAEWTFICQDAGPGTGVVKWVLAARPEYIQVHTNGYPGGILVNWPVLLQVGVWTHVAVVKHNSEYTLYRNGIEFARTTNSDPFPVVNAPLRLGYGEEILQLVGAMDDVVFYNRALTANEVQGLAGIAAPVQVQPECWGTIKSLYR